MEVLTLTTAKLDESSAVNGDKVRELRHAQNLSREELAVKAGISGGALAQVERGEVDARASTLRALAIALGVTTDELLR